MVLDRCIAACFAGYNRTVKVYGGETGENTWQEEREGPENRVEEREFQETAGA